MSDRTVISLWSAVASLLLCAATYFTCWALAQLDLTEPQPTIAPTEHSVLVLPPDTEQRIVAIEARLKSLEARGCK